MNSGFRPEFFFCLEHGIRSHLIASNAKNSPRERSKYRFIREFHKSEQITRSRINASILFLQKKIGAEVFFVSVRLWTTQPNDRLALKKGTKK